MSISQLELLSKQKYDLQSKYYPDRCNAELYIGEMQKEIDEVKQEIKSDNAIYLQDELGDILRDFLGLVESLRRDGMIDSLDDVIAMAVSKYEARVQVCDTQEGRDRVKKIQKEDLAKMHHDRYSK